MSLKKVLMLEPIAIYTIPELAREGRRKAYVYM
jgi:hypothetical protein